jgi:hypothetical protein
VVTRQSSDVLAIHDEAIAKAVRYVRENADKSIKVNDMVSASGISRRSLELKFIEHVGATPLEEIHRINSIALSNSWSRPTCQSLTCAANRLSLPGIFRSVLQTANRLDPLLRFAA